MKLLDDITGRLLWRPSGCLPALDHPDLAAHRLPPQSPGEHPAPCVPTVLALPGGKVIGDLRLVATRTDVVIGGVQSVFGCGDPQTHYTLKRRRLRLPRFHRGTALLLGTANGDNYYHWLLDILPRWKLLQSVSLPPYDFVLLPARACPFQEETLDRLQIPAAQRRRCPKNYVHQFERLIVPPMPFPVEEVAPWACAWVRSLFPENTSGPEKLYLSRGPASRRRLANECELEKALAARGFVAVRTDHLTVAGQARLFGSARIVVAPHGAALTNMIFAPPGAALVELFHPHHKNRCYVNLAAACGHSYASLDGQASTASTKNLLEYSVDVPKVIALIGAYAGTAGKTNG